MTKGYGFLPNIEYIKDTMNLSAREKLIWLEEANEFVRKFVSKKKLKIWEKFRDEVEGRRWIESKAKSILYDIGLNIENILWDQSKPIGSETQCLIYEVNGKKYSIEFSRESVEDCSYYLNLDVQRKLKDQIKKSFFK